MRAFMSERTNRPSWGTFEAPPDTRNMTWAEVEVCTARAEREVRAILAETEPNVAGQGHTFLVPGCKAARALAEALTTWIESEE